MSKSKYRDVVICGWPLGTWRKVYYSLLKKQLRSLLEVTYKGSLALRKQRFLANPSIHPPMYASVSNPIFLTHPPMPTVSIRKHLCLLDPPTHLHPKHPQSPPGIASIQSDCFLYTHAVIILSQKFSTLCLY